MRVGRVLAGAALALALAGCGGSAGKGAGAIDVKEPATTSPPIVNAGAIVRAASTKTVTATSARTTMVVTGGAGQGPAAVRGDGVFDFRNRRGQLTFTIPQLGAILAVFEGGVVYEKFPARYAPTFGGKQWLKIDLAKLAGAGAGSLGGATQVGGNDPIQGLAFLRAAGTVTDLGASVVRGEPTRHYRALVDLQKAAAGLPAASRSRVQQLVKESGNSTLPTDVWIDRQGRVRKLSYTLRPPGGNQDSAATVSVEYFAFGTPVPKPVLPPASQILDLGTMLGR